jgi:hypothetical protein
LIAKPI